VATFNTNSSVALCMAGLSCDCEHAASRINLCAAPAFNFPARKVSVISLLMTRNGVWDKSSAPHTHLHIAHAYLNLSLLTHAPVARCVGVLLPHAHCVGVQFNWDLARRLHRRPPLGPAAALEPVYLNRHLHFSGRIHRFSIVFQETQRRRGTSDHAHFCLGAGKGGRGAAGSAHG
jgi:hypothetical protein